MTHHFYRLDTGLFTGATYAGESGALAANTPAGCGSISGVVDRLAQRVDLQSGAIIDWKPPAPADNTNRTWTWDAGSKRWLPVSTLTAVKADKWEQIKAERAVRLSGTFTAGGKVFHIDQEGLNAAAAAASRAVGQFSRRWALADNSLVTLNAVQIIALADACVAAVAAVFDTSFTLRTQILAATAKQQVDAISWPG